MPAPTLAAFERPITVGIADLSVTNNPSVILTTYSLGSCLGVTLHDPVACVGGMLHLMLPDSSINKEKARSKPAMFADSGVPMLIDHALKLGASLDRMRVCVAGGSQIMDAQGFFNIGKRNYIALVMLLSNRGLEIDVEDIGGSGNRTMSMRLSDGQVKLKISGKTRPRHPMTELETFIDELKDVPPAPMVLGQLLPILSNPNSSTTDIVELISYDPGLTAKVLKMCNSAYFSGATPADTLDEAVARLGFNQLFDLVSMAVSQSTLGGSQEGYGIDEGELWRHSVVSAVSSRVLARYAGIDEGVAFTAALLHDLGKTLLAKAVMDRYQQVIEKLEGSRKPWDEVERDVLGMDHAELGSALLLKWNFPETIASPVKYHHHPSDANGSTPMASVVHIGNIAAYQLGHGFGFDAFAIKGDPNAFNNIGVSRERLPELLIDTEEELEKVEPMLKTRFK